MTEEQKSQTAPNAVTFEIVTSAVGQYHVRLVGENGEIVYTTEQYTRIAHGYQAVGFVSQFFREDVEVTIKRVTLPKASQEG